MNLIYNKEKYQYYLHELGEIRGEPSGDEKNVQIRGQINSLLEELRDKSDIAKLNTIYSILIAPVILVLLYLYFITENVFLTFIPIILIPIYLGLVNMVMKEAIKESFNARRGQTYVEEDGVVFLRSKIDYLRSALKIKVYRIKGLQYFYVIFFPVFLVALYFLVFNQFAFGSLLFAFVAAVVLASFYWYVYFEQDLSKLYNIEDLADSYKRMIHLDHESE